MSFQDLGKAESLKSPSFTNRTPSFHPSLGTPLPSTSHSATPPQPNRPISLVDRPRAHFATRQPPVAGPPSSAHRAEAPYRDDDPTLVQQLNEAIDQIKQQLLVIQSDVVMIQRLVDRVGTTHDTPTLREQLHTLSESTTDVVKQASGQMKQLATLTASTDSKHVLTPEMQLKQSRLSSDFAKAVQSFQQVQRSAAGATRAFVAKARRTQQGGEGGEQEEEDEEEAQRQVLINMEPQVQYNEALIEEREQDIKEIEQSILQVNDIFRDLNLIVNEQQAHFDSIEDNIFQARDHVSHANTELDTANRYQKSARRRKLMIFMILMAILGFMVLMVLLTK